MVDRTEITFEPDYALPPGEFLGEYLDAAGMSQAELARRTGLTPKTVNELVKGKAALSQDTAIRLERVLQRPAQFWNRLEADYQEARTRQRMRAKDEAQLAWLRRLPVRQMLDWGWIGKGRDDIDQLREVLQFFGVNSVDEWRQVWRHHQVAYRQSQRFEADAEAVSAWLRRGELQGRQRDCGHFDPRAFRALLHALRSLTREPVAVFLPALQQRCAEVGVAVEFVPELPRCRVSGATRWLRQDKALIQLSLRYRSDDQFWFSFFHEAGHLLLHGKRNVFVELPGVFDGKKEEEADRFAADLLIPQTEWRTFVARGRPSLDEIEAFSERIDIAPGVVVGRLQHERIIAFNRGNRLKQRFRWSHES